jgi:hypothetical protein
MSSSPESQVTVTFFPNYAAAKKWQEQLTADALAARIRRATQPTKDRLPWLKLARFGDIRTDKDSLRHDANVVAISGIEADYDDEAVTFDDAQDKLRKAGVAAVLYTSPSHTEDAPRWRVLCQLSAEYPPDRRNAFLARLNGIFGGIFANESWTLSQAYYFGAVNGNPSHRVEVIAGTPIDLLPELDATAIDRPTKANAAERPVSAGGTYVPPSDGRLEAWRLSVLDTLRREAVDGGKHYALLRTATAIGGVQAAAGFSDADAIGWMMAALPDSVADWDAAKRTAADGLARGRQKPIELDERPHPGSNRWNGADYPPPDPPPVDPQPGPPPEPPLPDDWPEPVDFLDLKELAAPILTERHVPAVLWPFIHDNAERMGVATSSVALCAIVSCSAAINEEWRIQPKRYDYEWDERARLWGAVVGPPSVLKSPIIKATTAPIEILEIKANEDWNAVKQKYDFDCTEWKESGDKAAPEPRPPPPRDRFMVESTTIEALQEVLRDDPGGKQRAPLGKVLVRQDELAEFLAGMDKYSATGKNSDRPAWLRAYGGGRHSIDRIGRGSFATRSWSCCLLGGIQPAVIRQIAQRTEDDGLIQRFILDVPGQQAPGVDRAPDRNASNLYRALIPALAGMHPSTTDEGYTVPVVLHDNAHAAREDIEALARAMASAPDVSDRLQATFGKWPGLFARLSLTFHLIEIAAAHARGSTVPPLNEVAAETASRVRRYMRAILAPSLMRAEALMFGTVQTEHATRIVNYVLARQLDRVTTREIVRAYHHLRPPEERATLDSTMAGLCLFGWLAPLPPRHEGATPHAWRVNPRVHILYAERAEAERKRLETLRPVMAARFAEVADDP